MSRFKIINVFDKVFVSFCVFLIIFAWLNFFARNLWFSFITSLVLSGAVLFIMFYLLEKTKIKKINSKKRIDDIEKTFLCFKTMTKNQKLECVKNIVSKNLNAEIFEDSIIYKHEQNLHQIFIATNEKILSEQTLFNILENRHELAQKILIICENYNTTFNTNLLKDLIIKIVDKTTFFDEYLSVINTQLDTTVLNEKCKKTIKQIMSNLFVPHKAKQYFFCGLILIFSSLILPYKTYYLIFGSLLMLFTILCKLQPAISNSIKSKNKVF